MAAGIVNMDKFTNRTRELTRRIYPGIDPMTVQAVSRDNPADTMCVGPWRIQSCWDRTDWPWFQLWWVSATGDWVSMPGRWYSFWEAYRHMAQLEFDSRMADAAGAVVQPDLEPTT